MVVRIVGIRLTPTTMLIMIPISTATNTPVKPPVRFYIRSAPPIQFLPICTRCSYYYNTIIAKTLSFVNIIH